jgi:hypothetical protein
VLTDQMRAGQVLMERVAEQQAALTPALARMAQMQGQSGLDDASRAHLRNSELLLSRLLDEARDGRAQATAEIRNEIRVLTRTITAIAEAPPAG